MKKIVLLFLSFFALFQLCSAQYYSTGQDRAAIVWREIQTDEFQLVYPNYFEEQAQRMARLLAALYKCSGRSLNVRPQKVSILLHAETTKSNGYFAWAPKRGELYTTPPDAGLPNDWLEHLATHEYRHVVQMDKLAEELPDLLSIIFGEQAVPAVLSYKVPMWFMEGDAVLSETLFSNAGRGRSPEFLQVMKAYLLGNANWHTYNKAMFGSYKDFVPNAYALGYVMVANTRKNYGNNIWGSALEASGKYPYPWHNFTQHSINDLQREKTFRKLQNQLDSVAKQEKIADAKALGISKQWKKNKHRNQTVTLYNDNMTELQARWKQERTYIDTTVYRVLSPPSCLHTDYLFPQLAKDGSHIALKTGYEDYAQFVKIKDAHEEPLWVPGHVTGRTQLSGDWLFWTETVPDLRWAERASSVVYCLNLATGEKQKIPTKQHLYMPAANKDNSLVVAVVKNHDYTNELLVVERNTGKLRFRKKMGATRITDPQFIDNHKIAYIFTNKGMGIATIDLLEKQEELLVSPRNVPLSGLTHANGILYFSAGYEGKNDIYSYNLSSAEMLKLTESPFGAMHPQVAGTELIYANYTPKGYQIVAMPFSEGLLQKTEPADWQDDFLLKSLKKQEACSQRPMQIDSTFASKYYRKSKNLFNFHSRSPFASSAMLDGDYDLGISTTSQNLLSTMFVNVGYRQKNGYKNGQVYANLVYKGWFPVISTELAYGKQSRHLLTLLQRPNFIDTATISEQKNRWEWETEVSFPFNLSRGKYARHFSIAASLEFTKDVNVRQTYLKGTGELSAYEKGASVDLGVEKLHQLFKYNLFFSNLHKKAYRDLYSPLGQQLSFTYRHTPLDKKDVHTYAIEGVFYFPSLFKHHGLRLYGGYQYQPEQSELLKDNIEHPRGTTSLLAEKKYSLRANYKFPLAYPDWSLGSALYVKRLNTSFFYDYGLANTRGFSNTVHSYGVELTANAHIVQIPIPITFGFRLGHETQTSDNFYNLLLSMSF